MIEDIKRDVFTVIFALDAQSSTSSLQLPVFSFQSSACSLQLPVLNFKSSTSIDHGLFKLLGVLAKPSVLGHCGYADEESKAGTY